MNQYVVDAFSQGQRMFRSDSMPPPQNLRAIRAYDVAEKHATYPSAPYLLDDSRRSDYRFHVILCHFVYPNPGHVWGVTF